MTRQVEQTLLSEKLNIDAQSERQKQMFAVDDGL